MDNPLGEVRTTGIPFQGSKLYLDMLARYESTREFDPLMDWQCMLKANLIVYFIYSFNIGWNMINDSFYREILVLQGRL